MSDSEELFLIKYYGDILGSPRGKEDRYWIENHQWTKDPKVATRFTREQGIKVAGELLIDQEWVTKLIHLNQVPMAIAPSPPASNFVIICDKDGDPKIVIGENSSHEHIIKLIKKEAKKNPFLAPYAAWQQCVGGFTRVFEMKSVLEDNK